MKTSKKILSFALALIMCFTIIPIMDLELEASAAYENTYVNTGNQRNDIVGVAKTQIGYREGSNNDTKYGDWYGLPNQPWCAMFVSWCARQANIPTSILKNSAVAGAGASYFNIPYYSGSSYTPKTGDLFFTTGWTHVGLVYYVDGNYFYTIEGNSNDSGSSEGIGVFSLRRKISDYYFGVPNYTEPHTHSYSLHYEAAHPHRVYKKCSCGEWSYTGETTYHSPCLICNYPQKPKIISIKGKYVKGENIIFSWNPTENTTHYNIYIQKLDSDNEWKFYEHCTYVNSGFSKSFPVGEYRCVLQSYNSNYWNEDKTDCLYTEGDFVYYTVFESIYDLHQPGKPQLCGVGEKYTKEEKIVFSWKPTENTTHYNIYIQKLDSDNEWKFYEHCTYVNSGFSKSFPVGEYRCVLQSYNSNCWNENKTDWLYTGGDFVAFSVYESTIDFYRPPKPELYELKEKYTVDESVVFLWEFTENTTHYNIYIQKLNSDNEWKFYEHCTYVNSGFSKSFPIGEYRCALQAYNSNCWNENKTDWLYTGGDFVCISITDSEFVLTSVSDAVIDNENGLIFGINEGFENIEDYVSLSVDGAEIEFTPTERGNGTGSVVKIMADGEEIASYKVVIFGDYNGDGIADNEDTGYFASISNFELFDCYEEGNEHLFMAADINGDGAVDSMDEEDMYAIANFEAYIDPTITEGSKVVRY